MKNHSFLFSLGLAVSFSGALALGLAACDTGSGGAAATGGGSVGSDGGAAGSDAGTPPPSNSNRVDASTTGAAELHVAGTRPTPEAEVFGANIADEVLQLWMVGDDGTTVTVIVDSAASPLPGEVTVGVPTQASSWVTVTVPTSGHVYNTFDGSGAIVINQCPGAAGFALNGSFNGIRLKDELGQGEIVMNGSFNLVVATSNGSGLKCKAPAPTPDASSGGADTTSGGDAGPVPACDLSTCDGPCCPFAECIGTCQFNCVMSTCLSNPTGCETCMMGCYPQCEVTAACQTAANAVQQCSDAAGCDTMNDEDNICVKTHCCAELQAAM